MTYNVFGGTLNLTQSVYPPVIGVRLFIGLRNINNQGQRQVTESSQNC